MRRFAVLGCAALFGLAVAVLPGLAGADPASTPTVTAGTNNVFAPMTATISSGGQVNFVNAPLNFGHNVRFVVAPAPPQCDSSLPAAPSTASWTGNCTFTAPGTYTFICDRHGHFDASTGQATGMYGTITVSGGTTATTTPTTTTTPPPLPGAASALTLRASQRGTRVKVAVAIGVTGSALSADLVSGSTVFGHLSKHALAAGRLKLIVALNSRGRQALRNRRTLTLTLRVRVTGAGASATKLTRRVTLHA